MIKGQENVSIDSAVQSSIVQNREASQKEAAEAGSGQAETEINLVHLKKNSDVNVLSNYLMGHIKRVRREIFDTQVFENNDVPPGLNQKSVDHNTSQQRQAQRKRLADEAKEINELDEVFNDKSVIEKNQEKAQKIKQDIVSMRGQPSNARAYSNDKRKGNEYLTMGILQSPQQA